MAISFNNLRGYTDTIDGSVQWTANAYFVDAGSGLGTFTSRSLSTSSTAMYSNTAAAGDYLLIGSTSGFNKPKGISIDISVAMASTSHTITWEYRKSDGTWAAFTGVVDNTVGFTVTGRNTVTWDSPTDWGSNATAVNAITGRMWYRARISAAVAITNGGTRTGALQFYDNAIRIDANHEFDSGTATSGGTHTITDTGKAWTVNALRNRFVAIHTGTGAGQHRVVTSNTATAITVYDPWDTSPDSTSQYVILANFEDIYQADVAAGWGLVTKAGDNLYAFKCFLALDAAAFGDIWRTVEFQYDFFFLTTIAATARYPRIFGYRLPSELGLKQGVMGNTFYFIRQSPIDSRYLGFTFRDSYTFSSNNRFVLRYQDSITTDASLRLWFSNNGNYNIDDEYQGWRSVLFAKSTTPRVEARNIRVKLGHSGIESPLANFDGVVSTFNGSLSTFITGGNNITAPEFDLGFNIGISGSNARYNGAPIQFFAHLATNSRLIDYKGVRFRPMGDVWGSSSSIGGRLIYANSVKGIITDEQGNPLSNVKVQITDSLTQNRRTSLLFDGASGNNDTLTVPNDANSNQFSGSTAFSFEGWFWGKTAGGSSLGRFLEKGVAGTNGYGAYITANTIVGFVYTGGANRTSSAASFVYGAWNHFAVVWNGSTIQLYLNGAAIGSGSTATGAASSDTSDALYIGSSVTASRTFDGYVRRVRLFRNKALTAGEYATLYSNGNFTQNQASPVSGCTAEYNFTEGSGTTVADTSGNGATATLGASTAAPAWVDNNVGETPQSITAFTGTAASYLDSQAVASTGTIATYSLTNQPSAATRIRMTVTNWVNTSNLATNHARVIIKGTNADGVAIQETFLLEEIGNGQYFSKLEYLTINASGIEVYGFNGNLTFDNLGIVPAQVVKTERWFTVDDVVTQVTDYNPITIKISRPGFEPVTVKQNIYNPLELSIALKRATLDVGAKIQTKG